MPNPTAFLKGFGVHKGMKVSGYTLVQIHISHDEIVRFQHYEYPMTLQFRDVSGEQNNLDPSHLLYEFQKLVRGQRVIDSAYGNPYACHFGHVQIQSVTETAVTLHSIGDATRI